MLFILRATLMEASLVCLLQNLSVGEQLTKSSYCAKRVNQFVHLHFNGASPSKNMGSLLTPGSAVLGLVRLSE